MSRKDTNFFEEHIEKMVLAIVGLVCLWLLIFRVLISPNYVEYGNEKFGPSRIDVRIDEQAANLEKELNRKPRPSPPYESRVDDFVTLVKSAVNIGTSMEWLLPGSKQELDKRIYDIPPIGGVDDVGVKHIRAVAYVPTEKVDEKNVYDRVEHEPRDTDFVTVEAKFDVAQLCESFYESFAGEGVQEEWQDPCLVEPVFAAVQLARQEMLADGSWSDWQIVPRTGIDHRRQMFKVVEDVNDLPPGKIKVRLLQFDNMQVKADLLQPRAYQIASAEQEWFPPSLHKEWEKRQREIAAEEKREAREAEREEREEERAERIKERSRESEAKKERSGKVRDRDEDYFALMESLREDASSRAGSARGGRSDREPSARRRDASEPPSISGIYDKFDSILITRETDFAKMQEPLLFWAHDDTIEPEKSYQYKIRLGVFNPIAGTDWFSEECKSQKNKVVLWSGFSNETETVKIPGTLYFFPLEIQEAVKAKTVKVQVSKYVLGYWYSKDDFKVKQGEVIGKVVESEPVDVKDGVVVPETIDYATGAVLVDAVRVNDWAGGRNLRPRNYFDMLYSFDGTSIKHVPVKPKYWPKELLNKFNEIKKSEKEPKKPLRPWGGRVGRLRRGPRQRGEEGVDRDEEYRRLMESLRRENR